MKLCIISDLHCTEKKGSNSFFYSDMPDRPVNQNPVTSILKKIKEEDSIRSEVILCLGDLGDKAYRQGIKSAWDAVSRIKNEMDCNILIGIPGNHDIDSRKKYSDEPFDYIENFSTNFPTSDEQLNINFWKEGYCIYEEEDFEILMINTVLKHKDEESANLSEISNVTLESINKTLIKDSTKTKVCILHHHPIKHSNIENWKDTDSIERGDNLLQLLNRYDYDIIIHGHKHQPRIVDREGLTIFAAGSFSSFENLQGTGYNMMFHVVNIESKGKGKVFSWEFNIREGWEKELNRNFPPEIGFGERGDIESLAYRVNEIFNTENEKVLLYDTLKSLLPEIEYLVPENLIKLGEILKNRYNLYTLPDLPLKPSIITTK